MMATCLAAREEKTIHHYVLVIPHHNHPLHNHHYVHAPEYYITRRMQGIVGAKPSSACLLNWNTVYVRDKTYDYLAFAPAESLVWGFAPKSGGGGLLLLVVGGVGD